MVDSSVPVQGNFLVGADNSVLDAHHHSSSRPGDAGAGALVPPGGINGGVGGAAPRGAKGSLEGDGAEGAQGAAGIAGEWHGVGSRFGGVNRKISNKIGFRLLVCFWRCIVVHVTAETGGHARGGKPGENVS